MSLDIVVNEDHSMTSTAKAKGRDPIVAWIMDKVDGWVDHRDNNFKDKWNEYYRLWRGLYKSIDATRKSERSRLISPALQQAIEVTVSELEEAVFSSKRWVDIDKTSTDDEEEKAQMGAMMDMLLEEYELAKIPAAMSEVFLNAAIYGTGIAKVVVKSRKVRTPSIEDGKLKSSVINKPEVTLVPIDPLEFAIDPLAKTIKDAVGCAHIMYVNTNSIKEKQDKGIYANIPVGDFSDDTDFEARGESKPTMTSDWVKIVEYHGLVPRSLLNPIGAAVEDELEELGIAVTDDGEEEGDMVEAIITIANDNVLLRTAENPFFMHDRSIIAYQHDRVPNRFWGRGVAEKGYSPQKALDAELRARIDAMAFSINPMLGINATLIPRELNGKFKAYPGRTIFTNGPVSDAIQPINFNPPPVTSFNQSGDLERMVEMGTGAFQAAAPTGQNPRNSTASGMSMIVSASIKRNKRTLQNIEINFLDEWVRKSAWRYMQADPETFPLLNLRFIVNSTLGIMARELESQQIVQLLNTTEPNSPSYWMLIKSLYEISNISNREEMIPLINQQLEQSLQPPEPSAAELVAAEKAKTDRFKAGSDAVFKKTQGIVNLAKAEEIEDGNILEGLNFLQTIAQNPEELAQAEQQIQ